MWKSCGGFYFFWHRFMAAFGNYFFGAVLFLFGAYSVLLANISLVYVIK